jgi:DnaJ-class molecular chaperone
MGVTDPYMILGVRPDASPDGIRTAFRRAVRERHPDTSTTDADDAAVRSVIDAYGLLIDPGARARYDAAVSRVGVPNNGARRIRVRRDPMTSSTGPRAPHPCGTCLGTGVVRSISVCPTCRGRAEITALGTTGALFLRCRTCRGVGRIRLRAWCHECGGTGAKPSAG